MTDDELREAVRQAAVDGKVSCKQMLDLAVGQDIAPGRIGKLCDELDIKIIGCQLGCFR